jgi:exosome complex component RRP41
MVGCEGSVVSGVAPGTHSGPFKITLDPSPWIGTHNECSMSGASIRRTDLLALSNLRHDGRKPHEIRRLNIQMGVLQSHITGGSALVEMGLTTVLAVVTGPMECARRTDERPDRAIIEVTLSVTPFAVADRRTFNANTDRRLIEGSLQIQRALEAAVLLHTYPKSRICVDLSVLADDGGRLGAAVNAATLALIDASIPMKDFVCACSAGTHDGSGMMSSGSGGGTDAVISVDLNRKEESAMGSGATVYLPVAILPQRGTLVLAQCDARLPDFETLEHVLEAAMEGCRAVFERMQAAVKEHAATLLSARMGQASISPTFPSHQGS